MIKQIAMPTIIKTYGHEAEFIAAGVPESVEKHKRRQEVFQERVFAAENELDALLSDGFALITQYEIKTDMSEEVVFMLHKVV